MYDGRSTMYDGGRRSLPMYDVRCTMYDCEVRARCAGRSEARAEAEGLTPPMYDFRCTMYDCEVRARCAEGRQTGPAYVRCTTYDVRLQSSRALRGDGGRGGLPMYDVRLENSRALCGEGRQTGSAHVRCWMYDVRLENSRALRGGGARAEGSSST